MVTYNPALTDALGRINDAQPQPDPIDWPAEAKDAAIRHGVDPNTFDRQMRQENDNYAPDVLSGERRSSAGAIGGAQLMPGTAADLGVDPTDPLASFDAAARYSAQHHKRFGGNERAAVAAYNWGPGNVENAISQYGSEWEQHIPAETQTYLANIFGGQAPSGSGSTAGSSVGAGFGTPGIQPPGVDPSVHPDGGPSWLERGGINPNQGGFRSTELNQPASGGYETVSPITTLGQVAEPLSMLEQASRGPELPSWLTGPAQKLVRTTVNTVPGLGTGVNAIGAASQAVGGPALPSAGDIAAGAVPTNTRDALLTLLPFTGDIQGLLGRAMELASPEIKFGVAQYAAGTGGGGNRLAREMYDALKAGGATDEEIAGAFGKSAVDAGKGGIDIPAQMNASREAGNAGAAASAKREYVKAIDNGASLDEAAQAAKVAAAKTSERLGSNTPGANVLATDETRSAMQQASENAGPSRYTPGPGWLEETRARVAKMDEAHVAAVDAAKVTGTVQPGATLEEAFAAVRNAGDLGKNVYLRWDPVSYQPGDRLPPSRALPDGVDSGKVYKGTSVIDPSRGPFSRADMTSGYNGNVYVVKGRAIGKGQDPGELLIRDAEVVRNLSSPQATPKPGGWDVTGDLAGPTGERRIVTNDGPRSGSALEAQARLARNTAAQDELNRGMSNDRKGAGQMQGSQLERGAVGEQAGASDAMQAQQQMAGEGTEPYRGNSPTTSETPLEQAVRDEQASLFPSDVGAVQASGLPGPLFEAPPVADVPKPPASPNTLEQQRLLRSGAVPSDATLDPAATGLQARGRPNTQAALLNEGWTPGVSIARNAARAVGDIFTLLPRVMQTAFDYSYPFRQGLLTFRNQADFWPAFGKGLRAMADEGFAREAQAAIERAPYNPRTLELTSFEQGATTSQREEEFISRLANKIPGVRQSQRGATVFINSIRSGMANRVARAWLRSGMEATDPVFIKDLETYGNYLNRATGRGNLGGFEDSVGALNQVFYGARRNVAMIQAPGYMFNASARVRKEAFLDFLGLFGAGMGTLELAKLAGADVGVVPGQADFGKIRVGNTRVDIWGGYQQLATLTYRIASGQIKNPGDTDSAWKAFLPFLGNKLSPQASTLVSTLPEGVRTPIQPIPHPFKLDSALTPLAWQGLVDAIKEDGAVGGALGTAGFFGAGTNSYETVDDARNKVAPGGDYGALDPEQQAAVNENQHVKDVVASTTPSAYRAAADKTLNEIQQRQDTAEESWKRGDNTQKITDIWHDLNKERKGARAGLEAAFTETFSGREKDDFHKALDGYYRAEVANPDATVNFDATTLAQKEYTDHLPPQQKAWIESYQRANLAGKSPLYQEYIASIDAKKQAGYFAPGLTQAQRNALDKAHPELDVASWKFNGVAGQSGGTLQSVTAVDQALALKLPNREVKFGGLSRPVNQTPEIMKAWDETKALIANFENDIVPKYADRFAQSEFRKPFAALKPHEQALVESKIRADYRDNNPRTDAALAYMGYGSGGDQHRYPINSPQAEKELEKLRQKYGDTAPKPGYIWYRSF